MERELITADLEAPELIGGRYRLERDLSADARGSLWRASDQAAEGSAVALRQISADLEPWLLRWNRLQGVLHPQVPRCSDAIRVDRALWLPRGWVEGEPYAELGLGDVVQLLNQLLPVLALLHDQGLSGGALSPEQLLRRSSDGLPVLLDLGSSSLESVQEDLSRLAALALGLVAPAEADALQALEPYQRLQSADPELQFASASSALQAFQQLELAESAAAPPSPPRPAPRRRKQRQEQDVEGRIGPVVVALVVAALLSTGLGWLLLSRGKVAAPTEAPSLSLPSRLPAAEVDQREQLLNRLRALQIDRRWFLKLVDASLLDRYPERGGRLPGDGQDDAPLRAVWNGIAEEWLSRVEQLPLELRTRLGSLTNGDWRRRQDALVQRGLSAKVVEQLVSGSGAALLSDRFGTEMPPEPFRQLWYAAAEQALSSVKIEWLQAQPGKPITVSASVPASGAQVFPIKVPQGSRLVLGVNGSPLLQMSVFDAQGQLLEDRGPLRVVSLGEISGSPVQLLVTNEGLSTALLTLSLRADP